MTTRLHRTTPDRTARARSNARAAVEAADKAFPSWSATPPAERSRLLERSRDLLLERQDQIARLIVEETRGTLRWGMVNVLLGAEHIAYAATETDAVVAEPIMSQVPGKHGQVMRRAVGVVLSMAPWNVPIMLAARAVAIPLAYGNTVVLKASEQCPRTHRAFVDVMHDAGIPDGAVALVTNEREDAQEVVGEIIAHRAVRRVNFTGSEAVGRIIAEIAGRHLKRVLLELGGKAPLVVLADADLDRAVSAAAFGSFMHQGQLCMSTERIVIDRSVAREFTDQLVERARALQVGDPYDPDTQIGPLVNHAAFERAIALIGDAVGKGANIVTGGRGRDDDCLEPTVLTGVTRDMRIYWEESFAPIVAIITVSSVEEAVHVANDSEYGLGAAVFSRSVEEALKVATRLDTGICHINDATIHDEPHMPFGGMKSSGWGRFGGKAGLDEFTELRLITIQDSAREYPI